MNYEDKRLHVINTFVITRHICVTQRFVSRARCHICGILDYLYYHVYKLITNYQLL